MRYKILVLAAKNRAKMLGALIGCHPAAHEIPLPTHSAICVLYLDYRFLNRISIDPIPIDHECSKS